MATPILSSSRRWLRTAVWLASLLAVAQAGWFCGCAGFLPISGQELDAAQELNKRIMQDPGVIRILKEHHRLDWCLDTSATPGPVFSYGSHGQRTSGKDREGSDVMVPNLDEYSTPDLTYLAVATSRAVKDMHFSKRVEFFDHVHRRTTYVIKPGGEVIQKK